MFCIREERKDELTKKFEAIFAGLFEHPLKDKARGTSMPRIVEICMQFIVACLGIILVGALPSIFNGTSGGLVSFTSYFSTVKQIAEGIMNYTSLTYDWNGVERELFPFLFEPVLYSLTLLLGALLIAYFISTALTYLTMLIPSKHRGKTKLFIYIFESLPDIFIVFIMQFFIVFFYQKTNILLINFVTLSEERVYLLPMLCLAIFPTIQLYRLSVLLFEQELKKDYVDLARMKGVSYPAILLVHILRNASVSLFFQSKKIVWFMLSNLFIIEYLFNIFGITRFLSKYMSPEIFTMGILLLFIPIFLLYTIFESLLKNRVNGGESL
ncbi:ABC transporter permease subunit [Bacillus sp. DJP31]|uniref:ABC transporter permease subunit n=1 Tax=Bacillus sp. DJP31 TaxID=3409789 RepID=UPI003BB620CE